jgi:hypothetical protein
MVQCLNKHWDSFNVLLRMTGTCIIKAMRAYWGNGDKTPHILNIEIKYSNPSVYEQSVFEFSLIRDAQINTCFSIYEPIFAYTSSFLSQTDRCSWRIFSGSNGKLIFVLRVFALQAILEERIKIVNRGITVEISGRIHVPAALAPGK